MGNSVNSDGQPFVSEDVSPLLQNISTMPGVQLQINYPRRML